mgnify:CR=1 FL=1
MLKLQNQFGIINKDDVEQCRGDWLEVIDWDNLKHGDIWSNWWV